MKIKGCVIFSELLRLRGTGKCSQLAVFGFYLVNSKGQRPIFAAQLGLPSAHQQFERVSTFSAQ